MRLLIVVLCMLARSAHCADTDEVRFKPQPYKPGKELNAKTYSEKSYAPSEKAASKTVGSPMSPAQVRQLEMKPLVTQGPLNGKPLEAPPPMQLNPYVQGDKVYPSTITPIKTTVLERKPYTADTNKLSNTAFIPAEKPKEKNPLLEPRQGIKILPTDDEK